ncbi:MAG: aromatic ring-hydroxylating dioxygenase subunit alpha [Chitinophagaceae bacterium]|nr:aromatic ring-hydroxylating dioxygenase subunit alpha [Chitinophagaceae bacterium]
MDELMNLLSRYKKQWSLEQGFYTSGETLAAESEKIWKRDWLFAGFTCEIPLPGDYITYTVFNHSAVIIRDDDGGIYAHHNTCRHRGSVICTEERGNEPDLKCPYHHWVYEKNGRLRSARMMDKDFDRGAFGLHPVHVSILSGVIFICFANDPPDFSRVRSDLAPYLDTYDLHHAKVAYRDRYELDANWKLIGENFRECYHCGPAHIEYCQAVIGADLFEERAQLWAEQKEVWRTGGFPEHTIHEVMGPGHFGIRYPLRPGFATYSLDGKPVAPLMGKHKDYDTGVVGLIHYPNFWMDAVADYIWVMRITPLDPARSVVDLTWLVNGWAEEGRDYDIERLTEFWKITGEQDWQLCENNQKGILSEKYSPGPLSDTETDVVHFHKWYLTALGRK